MLTRHRQPLLEDHGSATETDRPLQDVSTSHNLTKELTHQKIQVTRHFPGATLLAVQMALQSWEHSNGGEGHKWTNGGERTELILSRQKTEDEQGSGSIGRPESHQRM